MNIKLQAAKYAAWSVIRGVLFFIVALSAAIGLFVTLILKPWIGFPILGVIGLGCMFMAEYNSKKRELEYSKRLSEE